VVWQDDSVAFDPNFDGRENTQPDLGDQQGKDRAENYEKCIFQCQSSCHNRIKPGSAFSAPASAAPY
jgi:hypothetical protein